MNSMENQVIIQIRATQKGIRVVCDSEASIADVIETLRERLASGARFYAGADVNVDIGDRDISRAEFQRIRAILENEFNLCVKGLVCSQDALVRRAVRELGADIDIYPSVPTPPDQPPPSSSQTAHERTEAQNGRSDMSGQTDTVIIRHTCRSGSTVASPGNIVIMGNVNPGADVVAQQDIIVAGMLRGNAHAGAGGDTSAVVMALALEPKQLRIADKLGLPPSGERPLDRSKPVFEPEIAYIEGNQIVIEPYVGRFPGT